MLIWVIADRFTTPEGQTVSGSKLPNFTRERVEKALAGLKERVAKSRKDFKSPFKIATAVAFGDYSATKRVFKHLMSGSR